MVLIYSANNKQKETNKNLCCLEFASETWEDASLVRGQERKILGKLWKQQISQRLSLCFILLALVKLYLNYFRQIDIWTLLKDVERSDSIIS